MEPRRNEEKTPRPPSTRDYRGRVLRRALFKPLNLLTLVAGLGIFLTTGALWLLPLTLGVYATVVYLAAKDPIYIQKVTGQRVANHPGNVLPARDVGPERRARWLDRGETRQKVEEALVTYRKVLLAIDESDNVTVRVLEGAVPKLHEAANRLVDVASNRQRAAATLSDFDPGTSSAPENSEDEHRRQRESSLEGLRLHVQQADNEIDDISSQFMTLRAQVVRASLDTTGARQQAEAINKSLDGLNYRLEALNETFTEETR
ncbi:hypothetical protein [Rubrobacter indicoceani]|uniref:hypothetical protein n=1 Tax=Rubrobacter indicoceani TaxID=2051957 RepID=UPI000E5BE8E0|nr:hypothetical protein [Rubrobacter indicoceani]